MRDGGFACSHASAVGETPFARCEVECSLIVLQIASHIAFFSGILAIVRDLASTDNLHILHRHLREFGSLRSVGVSTPAWVCLHLAATLGTLLVIEVEDHHQAVLAHA